MTTVAELMAECSLKIDPLPVTLAELSVSFDAGRPKLLERLKDAGVSKLPDRQLMANTLSKAKREGRVVPSPDEVGATKLNGPEPTAPAHTGAPPGVLQTPGVIALPDGRKVSYREYGKVPDGFPILFLHGNVSSRLFEPVYEQTDAETIAAGARVIAFDRPGIGGSDPHPGRSYASSAEDLSSIAGALGLSRYAVLGFSSGAVHALASVALRPGEAGACGLVSTDGPYWLMREEPPGTLGNKKVDAAPRDLAHAGVLVGELADMVEELVGFFVPAGPQRQAARPCTCACTCTCTAGPQRQAARPCLHACSCPCS